MIAELHVTMQSCAGAGAGGRREGELRAAGPEFSWNCSGHSSAVCCGAFTGAPVPSGRQPPRRPPKLRMSAPHPNVTPLGKRCAHLALRLVALTGHNLKTAREEIHTPLSSTHSAPPGSPAMRQG